MKLPYLEYQEQPTKLQTVEFKGYNTNSVISDGEMVDCRNISTDDYPVLMPRKQRKLQKDGLENPTGLFFLSGKMCYVDGEKFYVDGVEKGTVKAGEKQFVAMGDRVVIWPDKTIYDISDDRFDTLQKEYKATGLIFAADKITIPEGVTATFPFKNGDGIKISGCKNESNNRTVVVRTVKDRELLFDENIFKDGTEDGEVEMIREVPDLEYICEYGNRLWGVKENTVYGSKLGDPTNFNTFKGIASDSYSASVGSDGRFTGCAGFGTHICFFKERCIHRLYGSKPSNFQFSDTKSQGVQEGCAKSIVNINDMLIYRSVSGIMAYAGGTPELISQSFAQRMFSAATAGTDGKKYYVSMKSADRGWELFVYDLARGLWVKEDETHVMDFAASGSALYILSGDKKIYKMNANDGESKECVKWSATFGEMTEKADEKKIHMRFFLQLELLEPWSIISVSINEDRKGWKEIYRASFDDRRTIAIPIVPTRCDFLNIRIEGKGKAKIYSLSKVVQIGSTVGNEKK